MLASFLTPAGLTLAGLAAQAPPATSPPAADLYPAWIRTVGELAGPAAVALDEDGTLWIATAADQRVRHVGPDGVEEQSFGGFGTAPGRFLRPSGLALGEGRVVVADAAADRVQVFDRAGVWQHTIGAGVDPAARLHEPRGLAVQGGRVYVADAGRDRIAIFTLDGRFEGALGRRGSGPGELHRPLDVAVDQDGTVWVADTSNDRVQAFRGDGLAIAEIGAFGQASGLFAAPAAVVARGDRVFVADRDNHRVQVFDTDGNRIGQWGLHAILPREGQGKLHYPAALDVRPELALAAVCEERADRVQLFGPGTEDELRRRLPGASGEGAPAPASVPHFGTACAADGDLVAVLKPESHAVAVLDLRLDEPIEIVRFGGFGSASGAFRTPAGLALEAASGRVWVTDRDNRRLQLFDLQRDPAAAVTQLALPPRFVKGLDLAALGSELAGYGITAPVEPGALLRDGDGRLFLADTRNGCVLAFDPGLRLLGVLGPGALATPAALALDRERGRLYALDADDPGVLVFDVGGSALEPGAPLSGEPLSVKPLETRVGGRAPEAGGLRRPTGLCVLPDGGLLIADRDAHRLVRFDPEGRFRDARGGPGLGAGELHKPSALCRLPDGGTCIVDQGNHRLQFFDADDRFRTAWGARLFVRPALAGETAGETAGGRQ